MNLILPRVAALQSACRHSLQRLRFANLPLQASPEALICQVCAVQAALYCIFDGHIGRKSASSCTKLLPEELRVRMAEVRPRLESGEGPGQLWEDVFLATDAALTETEDGTTATALLVWKDSSGNLCLQVIGSHKHTAACPMQLLERQSASMLKGQAIP